MNKFDETYRKLISEAFGDDGEDENFPQGEPSVNLIKADDAAKVWKAVPESDIKWLNENRFSSDSLPPLPGEPKLARFKKALKYGFNKTLKYDYRYQYNVVAVLTYTDDKWSCTIAIGRKTISEVKAKDSAKDAFEAAKKEAADSLGDIFVFA